ncbi:hypothetical protein K3495_g3785 [Podosphaera aphanis]|nr:hypothetical protein K3495_g3785 [Podosphaera aphanis]
MVMFVVKDDDQVSNASSENEIDEVMEDADVVEDEKDAKAEEEDDEDEEMGEDEDGEDEDEGRDRSLPPTAPRSNVDTTTNVAKPGANNEGLTSVSQQISSQTLDSPEKELAPLKSPRNRYEIRPEALMASLYDIVPTIAAPQGTSINALAMTPDMRFWFTGGSDCYIRKYDGVASINGKVLLTVAQRHPFVESVTKAAVMMSYWDNEEPFSKIPGEDPPLSPVYSLAVQSQALWILSGLDSGYINLYSVRHDEGKRIAHMHQHKSAVSVMKLASDEKSVLSGSWDKNIYDWDLHTGQIKRSFDGSGGQISTIEIRPDSNLAIPADLAIPVQSSGTFSSRNNLKTLSISLPSQMNTSEDIDGNEDISGSHDSLFGGSETNSLFGETAEDTPLSAEIKEGKDIPLITESNLNGQENLDSLQKVSSEGKAFESNETVSTSAAESQKVRKVSNGIIEVREPDQSPEKGFSETEEADTISETTFLSASMDGTLRVWDKRQQTPIATVPVRTGVPPWCMSACWSPDGNFIYAGRRNGTVEEYNIQKGLKSSERSLKFPLGSGPITALRAMPNKRHLICASHDILRLYDLKEPQAFKHSTVPFLIVPGPPRPGVTSALYIDPTCRYMLSAAGNRGWEGTTTEVLLGYEIGVPSL